MNRFTALSRLGNLVFVLLTLIISSTISCGKTDEQLKPQQEIQNHNKPTPTGKEKPSETNKNKTPSYDLSRIITFRQAVDGFGRTLAEIYSLPDGKEITIRYDWEGGTIRCSRAEARIKGLILAKAKVVGIEANPGGAAYQEVEEIHYAGDGSKKVIYKARSRFLISRDAKKIGESKLEGEKVHELFTHWGRVEIGRNPY